MSTIVTLAPKPTVEDEVRASVVELLSVRLAEAKAGDISTVVIITRSASGEWDDCASNTEHFSESVGRLEIIKHRWIEKYLREGGTD